MSVPMPLGEQVKCWGMSMMERGVCNRFVRSVMHQVLSGREPTMRQVYWVLVAYQRAFFDRHLVANPEPWREEPPRGTGPEPAGERIPVWDPPDEDEQEPCQVRGRRQMVRH
jgi:hypothetical protein